MTFCLAAVPNPSAAQGPSRGRSNEGHAAAQVAYAARAEAGAPVVDGLLDDASWQAALANTDFTQVRPVDGAVPTQQTDVRLTFDDDALYVSARMFDAEPSRISSRIGRRDLMTSSDLFTIVIDSYHDHRTAFRFEVNPAGVRGDGITTNDSDQGDSSWDPVWSAATKIDSLGWTAEIRIPFSQLRFSNAADQVWGINFTRLIFRTDELVVWEWAPNTELGHASLFGHLHGLQNIPAPRRIEALPYLVTGSRFTEGASPTNPFNDGSIQDIKSGFDLKYGITSDLTLNATFNPDFGQVEADPAVVNLSAFETYFSEKRPFFVEGASIFSFGAASGGSAFGAPRLFYSRRIGKKPTRFVHEEGGFVDNPTATRILGAAKISGKTGGWSTGLLSATTAPTSARIQAGDGGRTAELVEPLTNYSVLSIGKDFRGGSSGIGMIVTGVHRNLDSALLEDLTSSAYAGGIDFFHRFGGNRFAVNGSFSVSHIRGRVEAITLAQESSARYYQRPDQDYVAVDSTAESMTGYVLSGQAGKVSGNWIYGTRFFAYSPGLEVNDAGFERVADRIYHGVQVTRRWLTPGRTFRSFNVDLEWGQMWNYGGATIMRDARAGLGGRLLNYWSFSLSGRFRFKSHSDKATRGGPLLEEVPRWRLDGFFASDVRKPISMSARGATVRDLEGGWAASVGTGFNIRPTGALNVAVEPSFSTSRTLAHYVTQKPDPNATATFGNRYIFGELERRNIDLTLRMDLAITPDLSIQFYAQPYLSAGDFEGFKELAAPRTFDFLHYGVDRGSTLAYDEAANTYTINPDGSSQAELFSFANPDYRFRSLISNFVVRWEYLPGSTVFLVWNHGQSGDATDPSFHLFDEFRSLLADDQRNTLIVKVNYWLSR